MDLLAGARDPVRGSVQFVARVLDFGTAPVRELAGLAGDSLLAALLAVLGASGRDEEPAELEVAAEEPPEAEGLPTAEVITRGLLAGHGRYTRLQVAEQVGISLEEARRLWRAVGFAEVGDDQRVFTSADVAALKDVAGLLTAGIVDVDGAVELARPLGHLLSRLAVAQTGFVGEVLGERLAAGQVADDPQLPERVAAQAVEITHELLPVLERMTLYVWRRHLATEAGRALLPAPGPGTQNSRRTAVGFIDISGFTRLSRGLDSSELSALLQQFETIVLDTVLAHGGRVIKNLGDEALFVSDDPKSAAKIALDMVEEIDANERLPPVHAGLAYGPVLYRGGDVFGPVVNIASRITGLARSGTIRVDESMADALDEAPQFQVTLRAPRRVRGYLQLPSYRLRRASPARTTPAPDHPENTQPDVTRPHSGKLDASRRRP